MPDHRPTTYRDAGVDINAGDELVERIKPAVKRSMRPEVLGGLGGFGALVEVPLHRYKYGAVRIQLLSLVTTAIGFIILSTLQGIIPIAVVLFFLAIFSESFRPANATAIAEICPPLQRPRAFALNRLAINLGVSIGPAVGGLLASRNYHYLFWIDGLTCLAAAFLLMFYFWNIPAFSTGSAPGRPAVKISRIREDRIFLSILLLVFACGLIFIQLYNTWAIYLREIYGTGDRNIGGVMRRGDADVAVQDVLSVVARRTNATRGFVSAPSAAGPLEVVAALGIAARSAQELLAEVDRRVGTARLAGGPLVTSRAGADELFRDLPASAHIGAKTTIAIVPLTLPSGQPGFLYLDRSEDGPYGAFKQREINLMAVLANNVAMAILELQRQKLANENSALRGRLLGSANDHGIVTRSPELLETPLAPRPGRPDRRHDSHRGRDGKFASPASLVILPLQDVLGLDSRARMNVPGTVDGNWSWRLESQPPGATA